MTPNHPTKGARTRTSQPQRSPNKPGLPSCRCSLRSLWVEGPYWELVKAGGIPPARLLFLCVVPEHVNIHSCACVDILYLFIYLFVYHIIYVCVPVCHRDRPPHLFWQPQTNFPGAGLRGWVSAASQLRLREAGALPARVQPHAVCASTITRQFKARREDVGFHVRLYAL